MIPFGMEIWIGTRQDANQKRMPIKNKTFIKEKSDHQIV